MPVELIEGRDAAAFASEDVRRQAGVLIAAINSAAKVGGGQLRLDELGAVAAAKRTDFTPRETMMHALGLKPAAVTGFYELRYDGRSRDEHRFVVYVIATGEEKRKFMYPEDALRMYRGAAITQSAERAIERRIERLRRLAK